MGQRPRLSVGFRPNPTGSFPMAMTGTVKFFNTSKGFGFIQPNDGGKDVFVHISDCERAGVGTLNEGQQVLFEVQPDKKGKGLKAVNLRLAR
jgi:cold shock protein